VDEKFAQFVADIIKFDEGEMKIIDGLRRAGLPE